MNLAEFIWNSNAIEEIHHPLQQVQEIVKQLQKHYDGDDIGFDWAKPQTDCPEIEDHWWAIKCAERLTIRSSTILHIHSMLTNRLLPRGECGCWRSCQVWVSHYPEFIVNIIFHIIPPYSPSIGSPQLA